MARQGEAALPSDYVQLQSRLSGEPTIIPELALYLDSLHCITARNPGNSATMFIPRPYYGYSHWAQKAEQASITDSPRYVLAMVREQHLPTLMNRANGRHPRAVAKRSLVIAIIVAVLLTFQILADWKPISQSAPALAIQRSRPIVPQPNTLRCPVTKVSMLYGAHKFEQLESALDSHRRHCERWSCKFEILDRDLVDRKLYSKHYFLLSTMLRELSKPTEDRQEWLL